MDDRTALTTAETQELEDLEAVVSNGMGSFVEVGTALLAIRDKRLWRGVAESFQGFCQVRWGFSRRRANQLIEASEIVGTLGAKNGDGATSNGDPGKILPANDFQVRALKDTPPEKRKEVWDKAVETAPKDKETGKPKPTAAHVKRVVKEETKPDAAPVPAPPTDEAGHPIEDAKIAAAFACRGDFTSLMREVSGLKGKFSAVASGAAGRYAAIQQKQFDADVNNLHAVLRFCIPHSVCPYCGGRKCDACKRSGWMPEDVYKRVPADVKGEKCA